ncbi:cell division protein SepF [Peptococcaceae bacterium 1198_IL3148]
MDKMMGFMGLDEEGYEDEKLEQDTALEEPKELGRRKGGTVVSLHTQRQVQVVLAEPSSYDEVQNIADNLKNRRSVIVNLEKTDPELSRRVIDFMSGTTYALNGNMQKVGQGIFLFAPNNVDITNELKEQAKEKSIFSIFNS